MKYALLSILMTSTFLSAKTQLPDILFHSSYTETKQATTEQRKDRSYKGYCLSLLYLQNDYVDTKILHAEYEIESFAMGNKKAIEASCKQALEKPEHFSDTLLHLLKEYR